MRRQNVAVEIFPGLFVLSTAWYQFGNVSRAPLVQIVRSEHEPHSAKAFSGSALA
jgi:hypothetical protein